MTTKKYQCKHCGDPFVARVADRNRGWARFCSKSCAFQFKRRKFGRAVAEGWL